MKVVQHSDLGIRRGEFVALVAAIMSVNALGIDLMLPALPEIGRELGVVSANSRQWIVTAFMFGFGVGQLVYGPLADRYGRKPVLLVTVLGFVAASVVAAHAQTFTMLLAARVLQGTMSASTRVLSSAIVRDRYSGRQMARTLSVAQMIFFLVPILAPSIGQLLLGIGPWRFIFYALAMFAALVFTWALIRLPETLRPEDRTPISLKTLGSSYRLTLTNRYSIGYAVATSLTFGGIIAFISSSQQVFSDVFHEGNRFAVLFAVCAFFMACASFVNSRLVERLGTRVLSQTGICALIVLSLIHIATIRFGFENMWTYMFFQALSMTCIGLCGSNFGAMAMDPVGHIAGTASSVQGFISSIGAVAVGSVIGQSFNGTTYPLAIGYLSIGLAVLGIVYFVENRRLFHGHMEPSV
jgi:DHA1 family bicyclomycin/chloramphenicol resistance-like MFS transporter